MRVIIAVILLTLSIAFAKEPVEYVNPHIGAISHLLQPTFTTVHLPNSMLRFVPVKTPGISDHYVAGHIYGLPVNLPGHRQRHLLTMMPLSGDIVVQPEKLASAYDHDFETVTPYYYSVLLEDDAIQTGFTPASHCGFYRFTFQQTDSAGLVIRGQDQVHLKIVDEHTLLASEDIQGTTQYAYLKLNRPIRSSGTFQKNTIKNNEKEIKSDNAGMYLRFDLAEDQLLEVKYGISYIDHEQAHSHLQKELGDQSFESVKQQARDIWNKELGRIQVKGGTEDQKTVFYTALYRTLERMVNINEDGRYWSAYDKKIHQDKRPFYVDDWSWDSYRAHHPLRILLDRGMQADIIQSYVRMFEQSGWMPSFPQVFGDMKGMIGHHQAAIIADAWFKGIQDFDMDTAYKGLLKNAMHGAMLPWREGPTTELGRFYREHGYFPALDPGADDPVEEVHDFEKRQAVAVTLEHSYDDACLALLANDLGYDEHAQLFKERALNYKNVYNTDTGFMAPKREDGTWVKPFDPKKSSGSGCREYFAEVNSWTYSFHVQHDVSGLMKLMGGQKTFIERLDGLYEEPMYGYCRWHQTADIPDGTGMVGQFVMGNEQGFHVPYMYVYAGAPWKTQKRIRMLMNTWFRNDLMGICGDEDGGAMSAWAVFSAMGFYPVAPGLPVYIVGTPLFDEMNIQLSGGKNLVIKAEGNSAQHKYIQAATLNGKKLENAWFEHEAVKKGGELVFQMGPRPQKQWGVADLPPDFTND